MKFVFSCGFHEILNRLQISLVLGYVRDCFLYESSYGTLPTEETWKKWRSPPEKAEPEAAPSQTSKEDRTRKLQDSFSLFTPLDLFDLDNKTNHNVTALKRIPGVGRGNSQVKLYLETISNLSDSLTTKDQSVICLLTAQKDSSCVPLRRWWMK